MREKSDVSEELYVKARDLAPTRLKIRNVM
jgi:hypothetical protein